jgi:anthranilate synthase/aminodeoxychorismate synthase-like glutamine amidotransferase
MIILRSHRKMLLVIDNYDSFTYNLVQYLGELGSAMRIFRNDEITVDEIDNELKPEKILISPGPGTPDNAGITLDVLARFAGRIPILGVCLGHQAIGQHFGGNVVRAPEPVHGKPVTVRHDGKTIFSGIEDSFNAGRYHSLVVERESLPDSLEISAESPDGLIMGLRHKTLKIEGVQFHPESILTEHGKKLLQNFLEL